MRRFAQVLSLSNKDKLANVMIRRHAACGNCGKCDTRNNMTLMVDNSLKAQRGDVVILEMKEKKLVYAALLLYLLPLLGLICGYLVAVGVGFGAESTRIVISFIFLALALGVARIYGQRNKDSYDIEMIRIKNQVI